MTNAKEPRRAMTAEEEEHFERHGIEDKSQCARCLYGPLDIGSLRKEQRNNALMRVAGTKHHKG